jgi:hypothetical protein
LFFEIGKRQHLAKGKKQKRKDNSNSIPLTVFALQTYPLPQGARERGKKAIVSERQRQRHTPHHAKTIVDAVVVLAQGW